MIDISEAEKRLILHEGLRLNPYYCTKGKQTIGVGRNLDSNPISEEERKVIGDWEHGITKQCALYLLRNDIYRFENQLEQKISFWKKLDNERQYALLDMAFNLGIGGLLQFKNMLYALKLGKFNLASQECLNSKYAKETKTRAKRIANLIRTGIWQVYI